jgi:hypothetical protein
MNSFFKAIIAGWGAKKLGGGCLSTIVIFIVIYTLLGKCSPSTNAATRPVPAKAQIVKIVKIVKHSTLHAAKNNRIKLATK